MIDPILFQDISAADPEAVLGRVNARYDGRTGCYDVLFWGRTVRVDPAGGRVFCPDAALEKAWAYVPLIVVHYLLSAIQPAPEGEWVSEKDLPGGSAFFRGPHTLPVRLVAKKFEQDCPGFEARCRDLGGTPLDMADAAFSFPLLPGIPAAALLWLADDLFEGDARLLFDPSIARNLPLDIIFALGVTLCQVLSAP